MKILKTLTGSLLFPVCLFFAFTLATTSCQVERIAILKDIPDTTKLPMFRWLRQRHLS